MKSASNGGILKGRLQVLHVHILLVAPLGASHVAQPSTDQHEGRVAVWKSTHPQSAHDGRTEAELDQAHPPLYVTPQRQGRVPPPTVRIIAPTEITSGAIVEGIGIAEADGVHSPPSSVGSIISRLTSESKSSSGGMNFSRICFVFSRGKGTSSSG